MELKACPFCGEGTNIPAPVFIGDDYGHRGIRCEHCGIATGGNLNDIASLKEWNTRPIEDQLRAENEQLKAWAKRTVNYLSLDVGPTAQAICLEFEKIK